MIVRFIKCSLCSKLVKQTRQDNQLECGKFCAKCYKLYRASKWKLQRRKLNAKIIKDILKGLK